MIKISILKNWKLVMFVSIFLMALNKLCFADVVYLKNGHKFEGQTKQTPNGTWVDGMLFSKDEIKHIEEKPLSKSSVKQPWHQHLQRLLGGKTPEQKNLEEYRKRIRRNSKAIKKGPEKPDKENKLTKGEQSDVLERARRDQERERKEKEARWRKLEAERKKRDTSTYSNPSRIIKGSY